MTELPRSPSVADDMFDAALARAIAAQCTHKIRRETCPEHRTETT